MIEIIDLQKTYVSDGTPFRAVDRISLKVPEGSFFTLLGPSGCGKSTTLRCVAGLETPDGGTIRIGGETVFSSHEKIALPTFRRDIGMVFQSYAIWPHMTVFENVAYPLREHTELSEDDIEARVREKLEFVDLEPDQVMTKLPSELSGGMKKRVGIARGMANNAEIMLYDEPTSGLDPLTTATITRLILKLQRELNVTSIVVSHDIRSSFRMGTHIALLAERSIRFFGTPEEMAASGDRYIRDFLGGY